jgi:hypothetical protein
MGNLLHSIRLVRIVNEIIELHTVRTVIAYESSSPRSQAHGVRGVPAKPVKFTCDVDLAVVLQRIARVNQDKKHDERDDA